MQMYVCTCKFGIVLSYNCIKIAVMNMARLEKWRNINPILECVEVLQPFF